MIGFFQWIDSNPAATGVACVLVLAVAFAAKAHFVPWFTKQQVKHYQRRADKKGFGREFKDQLEAMHVNDLYELPRLFCRLAICHRARRATRLRQSLRHKKGWFFRP